MSVTANSPNIANFRYYESPAAAVANTVVRKVTRVGCPTVQKVCEVVSKWGWLGKIISKVLKWVTEGCSRRGQDLPFRRRRGVENTWDQQDYLDHIKSKVTMNGVLHIGGGSGGVYMDFTITATVPYDSYVVGVPDSQVSIDKANGVINIANLSNYRGWQRAAQGHQRREHGHRRGDVFTTSRLDTVTITNHTALDLALSIDSSIADDVSYIPEISASATTSSFTYRFGQEDTELTINSEKRATSSSAANDGLESAR